MESTIFIDNNEALPHANACVRRLPRKVGMVLCDIHQHPPLYRTIRPLPINVLITLLIFWMWVYCTNNDSNVSVISSQSAEMMNESISLSLQEFIASRCLLESTLEFFDHDHDGLPKISPFSFTTNPGKRQLHHLNAAKVALLLSKEFCNRYPSIHETSLASLHSGNIFVQLKCWSYLDATITQQLEDARALHAINKPATSTQVNLGHDHGDKRGSTLHEPNSSSSASSFDAALDEFFSDNDDTNHEDETHKICHKQDVTASVVDPDKKCSPAPAERKWIPISDLAQFRNIDQAKMCQLYCTLINVGVLLDPLNRDDAFPVSTDTNHLAAIQVLGNLIHTVFSQSNQPLSSMYQNSMTRESHEAAADTDAACTSDPHLPRHSKLRRNKDSSLFSYLVDSGHYPISICRLLSDMIDVGPRGKADSPFPSCDEVIHDLEQMSLYPEKFLHDPEHSFYSPNLLFGQRYYGREAEVTKILEISTRLEHSAQPDCEDSFVETVFISGIAGCGKTHMARKVGNFLSSLGWIVLEAKFDRCTEYQSREVICSVFDKLVSKLIDMKHGTDEKDMEFSARAEQAISDTFGPESLLTLANFIPSIHDFSNGIEKNADNKESEHSGADTSHWQLIILVSKLLGSILRLERFIMICLDDLQWCDSNMLTLIQELLTSVGQYEQEKQHLLLVGTYRHNEVKDGHPLAGQLSYLQNNESVNVTLINLSTLSRDDVCNMVMSEMRLPRRLVCRLADEVHKKTSGHAIFVVELLNLLLRDLAISYSPQLLRFDWDINKVLAVKTGDNIASLIISNLTSLQPSVLWALCVISCFGFKSEIALLRLFHGSALQPEGGFDLCIEVLVEKGFLELSGSVVSFTHDLIQQYVYEKMPINKRQELHLDIGMVLAAKTTLDSALAYQSIEAGMEQFYICDGGDGRDDDSSLSIQSLSGIATSQINKIGLEFISDRTQRIRFAGWNWHASNESARKSNFRAALYYCKNGILFLEDSPWLKDTFQLSVGLHEGAAFASFAVGNVADVAKFANAIIDSESVGFEQSLIAHYILIRSLETMGHYNDSISRGLTVLRRLNFDIPTAPTPDVVTKTMNETGSIASHYLNCNISCRPKVVHSKQKSILKIIDSVAVACFLSASPYLPLVACSTMLYSLQQGVFHCEESASALAIFGYFKVLLEGNLDQGQKWGNLAITILGNSSGNSSARARIYLYGFLFFWYLPIEETCRRLYETYTISMRCGDVDSAMYALCLSWRFQFFGGCKLSVVLSNYAEYMKSITKYSESLSEQGVLRKINLNELIGISDDDPFILLEGTVCSEAELLAHAKLKNNVQLIEEVHLTRFLSAFWLGDYASAMESFKLMAVLPSSKMPKIQALYYTFYRGIVAYRLFREGNGEHLLTEGNEVLSKVHAWRQTCDHVENKLLLLQAEYFASNNNRNAAKEKYEASIKSARDHGFVHEQGMAHECMGKYFFSIIEIPVAKQCFRQAHECYMQWGAFGKAEQVRKDHELDNDNDNSDQGTLKHERDW